MKHKKKIAVILACILSVSVLASCGNKAEQTASEKSQLEWWMPLDTTAATVVKSFEQTNLAQQLMKVTDTDIKFVHPPQGQESEKFNLLTASDALPDIITYNWEKYPGGPQQAIKEKVIIDLNQYKDKLPNLMKYLDENPEIKRMASTDDGQLYSFPFIRGNDTLCVSSGLIVRNDWLKELNIEVPETMDDWETMLTAFKEKKGATAPYCSTNIYLFAGAFNTSSGYYLDDGKVKYGPFDPSYKDYIVTMNRWYKNGLIDADFATRNRQATQSNILNGVSGATNGSIGSGIGAMMTAGADIEGFDLVGVPFPTLTGGKPEFGLYQSPVTPTNLSFSAISTTCENIDAALKLLDYGYSEEGHMLYNFGVEGESYEMKDGYPTYTEKITNNPEGLSMNAAMSTYMLSYSSGPFVQDVRYMEQYAQLPQQREAWETWSNSNAKEHLIPNLYMKEEELSRYAELKNSVDTRANEITLKLIIGTEPMENYDKLIEELRTRGADEVVAMQQAAYDRFLLR
ncbi:MAG: extracellular solute-binding protein [Clostridia bacterium]|nr:extracellular solute-binding protein [Clostridia bacterium]